MALFFIASKPAQADGATRRWVEVVVIGSEDDAHALDRSLRELLTRLEIDLDFRHVDHMTDSAFTASNGAPGAGNLLAVVAIDLDANPVTVTFRDPHDTHALGKREVPRDPAPNVTVETVAHIVQVGVEDITSQNAAAAASTTPESAPPPVPTASAAPTPLVATLPPPALPPPTPREEPPKISRPPAWGLDVGAFVGGDYVSSDTDVAVGGGLATSFAFARGNWRPALLLSASYHAAIESSDDLVTESMKLMSVRLVPTLQLLGGSAWSLDVGAGAGIDTWFSSPSSSSVPRNFLHDGRTDVDPVATAMTTFHLSIAAGTDLFLAFALPVDLAPHRYVEDIGGTHDPLFAPARVRPALAFGFELTALGRSAYGGSK